MNMPRIIRSRMGDKQGLGSAGLAWLKLGGGSAVEDLAGKQGEGPQRDCQRRKLT